MKRIYIFLCAASLSLRREEAIPFVPTFLCVVFAVMMLISCKTVKPIIEEDNGQEAGGVTNVQREPVHESFAVDMLNAGEPIDSKYSDEIYELYFTNQGLTLEAIIWVGTNRCLLDDYDTPFTIIIHYQQDIHECVVYTKLIKYKDANGNSIDEEILVNTNRTYVEQYGHPPYYDGFSGVIIYRFRNISQMSLPLSFSDYRFENNELVGGTFKLLHKVIFKTGDVLEVTIDNIRFSDEPLPHETQEWGE